MRSRFDRLQNLSQQMEILLPLTGKHAAVNQRVNVNFKVHGSVIVCISDCFYRLERGLKELGAVRASTRMRNIAHLQRRAAEHFQVDGSPLAVSVSQDLKQASLHTNYG